MLRRPPGKILLVAMRIQDFVPNDCVELFKSISNCMCVFKLVKGGYKSKFELQEGGLLNKSTLLGLL